MNRLSRLIITVSFALLVGSACGPAVSDDARIISFEVTPAALPPGGGEVEARWKVEAARKVVLEIDGEQREVEPEASLSVPIADTTKLVLYAHGKVGGDRRDVLVSVEHINVSGTVVDPTGAAVEGIEVRVNGGEAVLTDGNGHFATDDVVVAYSIHLRAPAGKGRQDQLWLGLQSPEVTVSVPRKYSQRPLAEHFESRTTWTGGGVTAPPGTEPVTQLLVFSAEGSGDTFGAGAPVSWTGTFSVYLDDPPTRTVTLVVLQGYVEHYIEGKWQMSRWTFQRAGIAEDVAADSASVTVVPAIALEAVETPLVPVEITAEPWLTMNSAYPRVVLPGLAPLDSLHWGVASYARSITLPIPPVPGASVSVRAQGYADDANRSRGTRSRYLPLTGSEPLMIPLSVPPDLVLPMDNTEFKGQLAWTRPAPGPCRVYLSTYNGTVDIHIERRAVSSADLARAGITLESNFGPTSGSWKVWCPDGFDSLASAMADLPGYASAFEWDTTTGLGMSDSFEFYVP